MISSMTGFGRGTATVGADEATVEMRSVNSRFCEVSLRTPRALNEHEGTITKRVKDAFARGRISVQVQLQRADTAALGIQVDAEKARAYGKLLEDLRAAAGIEAPVTLQHVLAFQNDILVGDAADDTPSEDVWEAVQQALDIAIAGMAEMRRQEGAALRDDLAAKADAIERHLAVVEERAPERVAEAREKLQARLAELLGDETRVDSDRLEHEIAMLADKLDVNEESVRLHSHLKLFREALGSTEPVGRKLNFISQEINREINTIGSKANDPTLAHEVVAMKEALEKIREQVENVE